MFGVRKVSLLYIIRENIEITLVTENNDTITYDPCLPNTAHSSSDSILKDLILHTSYSHPLFKQNNTMVFMIIKEAARGSQFTLLSNSLRIEKIEELHSFPSYLYM